MFPYVTNEHSIIMKEDITISRTESINVGARAMGIEDNWAAGTVRPPVVSDLA